MKLESWKGVFIDFANPIVIVAGEKHIRQYNELLKQVSIEIVNEYEKKVRKAATK